LDVGEIKKAIATYCYQEYDLRLSSEEINGILGVNETATIIYKKVKQ